MRFIDANEVISDWYKKTTKESGYKGCRNCKHQIDILRACEWAEHGGDGQLHLICPRWEKGKKNETD